MDKDWRDQSPLDNLSYEFGLFHSLLLFNRIRVFFISIVLLRIPTAVHPMTDIEGLKYQASDG